MPEANSLEAPPKKLSNKQWNAIRKILGDEYSCVVLITCDTPSATGEMPVELTVEGDKDLAQMLLSQAMGYIDQNETL